MESLSSRHFFQVVLLLSLFLSASSKINAGPCYQELRDDQSLTGSGTSSLFLPKAIDPYGKGLPREVHETEKAGYLYPLDKKFDAQFDENGKRRPDGRYLFVVARDVDGARRLMVVPRFEFDKADGKILNTHRTMFRKYPDVFGPSPNIEVMGELEILGGSVQAYNNKAGTAYDLREAEDESLFDQRRLVAESMGIDLKRAHNIVNYTPIALAKDQEGKLIPGRHIEEEDYIKLAKLYHAHPETKALLSRYDELIQKAYVLFPEQTQKNPRAPFDLEILSRAPFNLPKEEQASFRLFLNSVQSDRPETVLANALTQTKDGALRFSRELDRIELLLEYAQKNKLDAEIKSWDTYQGPHQQRVQLALSKGAFDELHGATRVAKGLASSVQEKQIPVWKVPPELRDRYLSDNFYKAQIIDAQVLIGALRERFGLTKEVGGPFDYARFTKELKLGEDDQFTEDHIAQKMIYDLFLESEKKDANPVKLFDEMNKKTESASEDDLFLYPYPSSVVSAYLRTLGIRQ